MKRIELIVETVIGPRKLTRFEKARIIGARALQISMGAPVLVDLPEKVSDPIDISLMELNENALPMTIRRALPDKTHQDIAISDLLG
jgi:DNA-directed RNA polymerase I, II, and III subunit RPABC2